MHLTLVPLLIAVLCLYSALGDIWNQMNSVTFQMTELLQCEDKGTGEFDGSLRLSRKNRTLVVLEVNATLQVPLDNSIETTMFMYSWGNGGYKPIYTMKNLNICKDLAFLLGKGWESVWTHAGLTAPIKCPIPKGTYKLIDFDVQDLLKNKWPAFPTGRFKVLQLFSRNGDTTSMGCFHYVVEMQLKSFIG